MTEDGRGIPRGSVARTARLASLPLGAAGRATLGIGKRPALEVGDHFAGHFKTKDRRSSRRRWIKAAALKDVGPVDARGHDLDQHLAGSRRRDRPFDQRKLPRTLGVRRNDREHG